MDLGLTNPVVAVDAGGGLGEHLAAKHDLEQISPANRAHYNVLQIRWHIHADAEKRDTCLDI